MLTQIVSSVIFVTIYYYILRQLSSFEHNIKKSIIFNGTLIILSSVPLYLKVNRIIIIIMFMILSIILYTVLYKKKIYISIISVLFSYFTVSIADISVAFLIGIFVKYKFQLITNKLVFNSILCIVVGATSVLIVRYVKKFFVFIKNDENISIKQNIIIIICLLLSFSLILINNHIFDKITFKSNKSFIIGNMIILNLFFIATIYLIYLNNKYFDQKIQIERMKMRDQISEKYIANMRKFKHEYANMYLVINGYIENNDFESIKKFFKEDLKDENIKLINNDNLMMLTNIENAGIRGLLSSKIIDAENYNIIFYLKINCKIDDFIIKTIDMCKLIGAFLDNAIEASKNSPQKTIDFSIDYSEVDVIFTIANSYTQEPDIKKIYEYGYSTKGRNRGVGLSIAQDIVEKYDNVLLNTYIKNKMFVQEIIINKK